MIKLFKNLFRLRKIKKNSPTVSVKKNNKDLGYLIARRRQLRKFLKENP